jgi:hypothetical protein
LSKRLFDPFPFIPVNVSLAKNSYEQSPAYFTVVGIGDEEFEFIFDHVLMSPSRIEPLKTQFAKRVY